MDDGVTEFSHLCRVCGKKMTVVYPYEQFPYHITCAPDDVTVPGMDDTLGDIALREDLTDIILWGARSEGRSQQVMLGCSEAGDPCERKIAYTLAGSEQVNHNIEVWPSTVGTSIHTWLESKIKAYQQVHGDAGWLTELEVWPSDELPGHTDLYHRPSQTVLDLKNPSRANYRKMKKEGVGQVYETQFQLYGAGNVRAGRPVKRVGVVMLPRDGNLKEMWVKTWPYDRDAAWEAVKRVRRIGREALELDVQNHPENYARIPAEPSRLCGWCKFYRGGTSPADGTGCPGQTTGDPVDDLFQ